MSSCDVRRCLRRLRKAESGGIFHRTGLQPAWTQAQNRRPASSIKVVFVMKLTSSKAVIQRSILSDELQIHLCQGAA